MSRLSITMLGLCLVCLVTIVVASQDTPPDNVSVERTIKVDAKVEPISTEKQTPSKVVSTQEPVEMVYCVREGGFPSDGTPESDYPECSWVDRIDDVPEGEMCIPSGCNSSDPEATRRFWCLDGSGDTPPMPEIPTECHKYFR